jgi:hypothetical protein
MNVVEIKKKEIPLALRELLQDVLNNPENYQDFFVAYTFKKSNGLTVLDWRCSNIDLLPALGLIECAKKKFIEDSVYPVSSKPGD